MMSIEKEYVAKVAAQNSLLFFTKYLFKELHRNKWKFNWHHKEITDKLESVAKGEIKRLIINIPPRYSKTEIAVKMFIAWSIANNPRAKFIHLSYSDDLALDNSEQTKEYILSDPYQNFWNIDLKKSSKSKKKWYTEQGGGVYATATGGQITGFGAGNMDDDDLENELNLLNDYEKFGGAIIIDDPIKPDDARSDIKRNHINGRYNTTIRSRVNSKNTPVILIMQRVHENDMTGFLLNGGSGEKWEHLIIPALNDNNEPLWEYKHNYEELQQIKTASPKTFSGQYMQKPAPDEGNIFKKDWFDIIDNTKILPATKFDLFIDGAWTKNTNNDPTGYMIAGKQGNDVIIYFYESNYKELPEAIEYALRINETIQPYKMALAEPKASGKGFTQLLRKKGINASDLRGDFIKVSKEERAETSSDYVLGGHVKLVKGNWNEAFLHEVCFFPNAKHDEAVDLLAYAVERYLIGVKGQVTGIVGN